MTDFVTKILFPKVYIKFSWEGFVTVDIINLVSKIGYSKNKARRLLKVGAVKVRDTKLTVDEKHFVWYKRVSNRTELLEPEDLIYIGKNQALLVKAIPFTWYEKIYYHLRDKLDAIKDLRS